LRLVQGRAALAALDPGGLEVLDIDLQTFRQQLADSNHTLKRALTDQHVFAGIGNAYSDEILLRARLSPFQRPVRRLRRPTSRNSGCWPPPPSRLNG
jgi:formamidopyrimidine-DNA glycosylase